jgi:hypothetical protein
MTLPHDVTRCLGEKPAGKCERCLQCERYLQRDSYGPATPFARWLCGPFDNDFLIRDEKTQPLPTQAGHP